MGEKPNTRLPLEGIMSQFNASMTRGLIGRRGVLAVGLLALIGILLPASAPAGGPTDQVRGTVDKVLSIVGSSHPTSPAEIAAQRAQLTEVIYPRFDFNEMAKRSLGQNWARRSAEEQREFVTLFASLMEKSYASNIESYTSQKVLYTRETTDKDYAEVDTQIVTPKGPPVSINYKLHSVDKEWKVYDVVIEDISTVNNYRSQFDRVIQRSSFQELMRTLKEKQS